MAEHTEMTQKLNGSGYFQFLSEQRERNQRRYAYPTPRYNARSRRRWVSSHFSARQRVWNRHGLLSTGAMKMLRKYHGMTNTSRSMLTPT